MDIAIKYCFLTLKLYILIQYIIYSDVISISYENKAGSNSSQNGLHRSTKCYKSGITTNIKFISRPAGWDSMKKISILYENMQSCKPDDYYRDIIVQPATRKVK